MKVITAILSCVAISVAAAESRHPCVYFRADELPSLREKAKDVAWAREIVARWHREVDSETHVKNTWETRDGTR